MCFFCRFRAPDRYGDVGHHLLVQDAPSFIQKYISLIFVWSCFHVYTFQRSACFSLISMFWPFPGLLVLTMTSISKHQYRQRFRVQLLHVYAVYIWSNVFFLENSQFLLRECSWTKSKKPDQFAYTSHHTRFLDRIPSCSP
jgi:hypothetical protein